MLGEDVRADHVSMMHWWRWRLATRRIRSCRCEIDLDGLLRHGLVPGFGVHIVNGTVVQEEQSGSGKWQAIVERLRAGEGFEGR